MDKKIYAEFEPDDPARIEYARNQANNARTKFLEKVNYITSQLSILKRVERLVIGNSIYDAQYEMADWNSPEEREQYFLVIAAAFQTVIEAASNLKELTCDCVPLTENIIRAILASHSLHTLNIQSSEVLVPVPTIFAMRPSDSLVHFTILPYIKADTTSWRLLPALPNLRWLQIFRAGRVNRVLPPRDLRFDFNIFATLERMYFKFAQRPEVTELCEMLTRTALADGPGLRLTHFKIECEFGLDRAAVGLSSLSMRYPPPLYRISSSKVSTTPHPISSNTSAPHSPTSPPSCSSTARVLAKKLRETPSGHSQAGSTAVVSLPSLNWYT